MLANKLSMVHKLSQHSGELVRQMDEYRGAPGKMEQWLSDAHRRHEEVMPRVPFWAPIATASRFLLAVSEGGLCEWGFFV